MFERSFTLSKAQKIDSLEVDVASLQALDAARFKQLIELRGDLEHLMNHLGLKFEDVNERRVVEIKTFEKFKK